MRNRRRPGRNTLGTGTRRAVRAFTLVELLVSIAILATLIAILSGAVARVRSASRDFGCKNKLKTVASDFFIFADEWAHGYRGDSEAHGNRFDIHDFQEKMYGLSEFWNTQPTNDLHYKPQSDDIDYDLYDSEEQPMMCPEVSGDLGRHPSNPCGPTSHENPQNISTAFNMRLRVANVNIAGNRYAPKEILLNRRIMERGSVPLAFDVDGAKAVATRRNQGRPLSDAGPPFYSAPAANDPPGSYFAGSPNNPSPYWFPALRHNGRLNAAFIGGHVLSSPDPENATGWDWNYQPKP